MPRIEETPGYCKGEDLASLFVLSDQDISRLTRDGVLKKRDTPAGKRYNVVEATRAYVQHLRDKANGRGDSVEDAELRIMRAKAEIAEREAEELRGWPL